MKVSLNEDDFSVLATGGTVKKGGVSITLDISTEKIFRALEKDGPVQLSQACRTMYCIVGGRRSKSIMDWDRRRSGARAKTWSRGQQIAKVRVIPY